MAITKMEGRTYDMLKHDKRVRHMQSEDSNTCVRVFLHEGWYVDPLSTSPQSEMFDNWEAARNWVRKAKQVQDA